MIRRRVPPPGSLKVPHTSLTTPPERAGVGGCSAEGRPSEESMGAKVLAGFRALRRAIGGSPLAKG
jgi:hypothetical protein